MMGEFVVVGFKWTPKLKKQYDELISMMVFYFLFVTRNNVYLFHQPILSIQL